MEQLIGILLCLVIFIFVANYGMKLDNEFGCNYRYKKRLEHDIKESK